MAKATPTKVELQRIADIITSDEYETEQQMARAIFHATLDILRRRDWYVVGHYLGSDQKVPILYGLEPTALSGEKAAMKLGGGQYLVFKVNSQEEFAETLAHQEALWKAEGACTDCGHEKWQHEFWGGWKGEKRLTRPLTVAPCSISCPCPQFQE